MREYWGTFKSDTRLFMELSFSVSCFYLTFKKKGQNTDNIVNHGSRKGFSGGSQKIILVYSGQLTFGDWSGAEGARR